MSNQTIMLPVMIQPLEMTLPKAREAHVPPEERGLARDDVRLMVTYRNSDRIEHARFTDLPHFLRPGDLIVINASATIPAALTAVRDDGSKVRAHISTRLPADLTVVEFRKAEIAAGEQFEIPGGGSIEVLAPYPNSQRLWVTRLHLPESLTNYLEHWGRPVKYDHTYGDWPLEAYQNVFASVPGSSEMPSAGRGFTARLMDRLSQSGVYFAPVILHTGVASLESDELPYEEYFEVPHEAAAAIQRARERGSRVIAVGTSSVRAVETAVDESGRAIASRGWTNLVITPETELKLVDGMLTGFHEPKATHLGILQALGGYEMVDSAYQAALEAGYLWHEFGDLQLILSGKVAN